MSLTSSLKVKERLLCLPSPIYSVVVLMALVMGAMTAGEAGAMAPDFGEAKLAANRIITLLNMKVCNLELQTHYCS